MNRLKSAGKAPVYYLAYRLYDMNWQRVSASDGAIISDGTPHHCRMLSVDLRVGSPRFDNTHYLRGRNTSSPHIFDRSTKEESILPGHDASIPLQECLWLKTDEAYKTAQERYAELCASKEVMATEEDSSNDFSPEPMQQYSAPLERVNDYQVEWADRARKLSKLFLDYPGILDSDVSICSEPTTRYIVNSEGSRTIEQHLSVRISVKAQTQTKDGMQLALYDWIEGPSASSLPDDAAMTIRIKSLADSLEQLRNAPLAETYVGPAILSGRAAAVIFHETFGHRVEAVHEKNENEGKTFVQKLGTAVMPKFISVVDDPSISQVNGKPLSGHYKFDDEGVPGSKVTLINKGILTGLLLGRTPVQGFPSSNGHGRSSPGWNPGARQANLVVLCDQNKRMSSSALRKLLIEEAKRQHKSYGLFFDEVAGGSTGTTTRSEQTYSVYPLRVYKVFTDGRPDQLIRGIEIVGTPLATLERILACGTDSGIFNGRCSRDSGLIPVSAVAPSLLVRSIETKRTQKNFYSGPILPPPGRETSKSENK